VIVDEPNYIRLSFCGEVREFENFENMYRVLMEKILKI